LPEPVALAKREPGHLSFASDGPTNMNGLLGEWLNRRAGTQILQVPYARMPQGVEDTLAGRTQIVI
jgi:tripartite-type tricarboxylate transporter receptor subunit TctC